MVLAPVSSSRRRNQTSAESRRVAVEVRRPRILDGWLSVYWPIIMVVLVSVAFADVFFLNLPPACGGSFAMLRLICRHVVGVACWERLSVFMVA